MKSTKQDRIDSLERMLAQRDRAIDALKSTNESNLNWYKQQTKSVRLGLLKCKIALGIIIEDIDNAKGEPSKRVAKVMKDTAKRALRDCKNV